MPCLKGRKPYPMPSKEELETAYKELRSLKECAAKFGVSYECLRSWLKSYNVPLNKQGVNTNAKNKIGKRYK